MDEKHGKKPLYIIDGYGFIFRAYHVQPPLTSPSGQSVGALYGFTSMLIRVISDFKPEHAVIVLDHSGTNFRHELYDQYKANRPPAPEDLVEQLKLVQSVAEALNFKCLSKKGFEADDIIATLAKKANAVNRNTVIVSSDKDLMQLIGDNIQMYDPAKSKYISRDDVITKFGVFPEKVRDVQALMGDSSDNIPGVKGIGPKTAAKLINEFDSLENLLANKDKITNPRQQKLISENTDNAMISWKLVGLESDVDIDKDIENFHWSAPNSSQISDYLNQYGFKSLHKRVENLFNVKIEQIKTDDLQDSKNNVSQINKELIEVNEANKELENFIESVKISGSMAVYIEENKNLILSSDKLMVRIPYKEIPEQENLDFFSYEDQKNKTAEIKKNIDNLLIDKSIKKITYDLKSLLYFCDGKIESAEDLQIMHYLMSAGAKQIELKHVIKNYTTIDVEHLAYFEISQYFIFCYQNLRKILFKNKLLHIYENIDLPLCYILYDMENRGITIDINILNNLSKKLADKIKIIEDKIFTIAGEEFNIGSPKQLGEILFDKLKLPFAKINSKSKSYSTNVDILEKLQFENYEIADLLLEYRHFTKLKNTYTDTIPQQVNSDTGKIHTTFLQCVTTTGRLSSINPNVQNIPTRTTEGKEIRSAFVSQSGYKLISADYSQIELRILSDIADIKTMQEAFKNDQDIHTETAKQIFNTENITPELRRKAKAINFGIIYGISSFGLARQLNISKKEAAEYMDKYFENYPGIKQYMSKTIEFAKTNEFTLNEIGRKCFVPSINNKNHTLRSFSERAAINAPIQSLDSDIVKIAMINLYKEFKKHNLKTAMILQIHDELIFESPEEEVEKAAKIIKSVMERSYNLNKVNLNVDLNDGTNWQDIH